ncbi:hypothetical protein [Amycolatopsis anabasis]|uniref:hypothetical protein n=1 Tax=Amycolatopsis anabasis TaxID=1840409 RepID=UPI00131BD669|nr:hypothetical protein [Amycolatopsis anabasis]
MVHTTFRPRATLAALALGAGLAATITGTGIARADTASTAYGISASGADPLGAQPSVSSAGAVRTSELGSVRSKAGFVVASSLRVSAGAGTASASVGNVTVAGKSIGAVSTTCTNGKAAAGRTGTVKLTDYLTVTYGAVRGGNATGATITLTGAGNMGAETVQVAVVSCGTGTPPNNPPGPGNPPQPGQPAPGKPAPGKPAPGHPAGGKPATNPPNGKPGVDIPPAPKPERKPGHPAVTG